MVNIAIVDDEINEIRILQRYLVRFSQDKSILFRYTVFRDGKELLAGYKPNEFDVIFLDIEMREIDGLKTAEKIRENDDETILIFVTQMAQYAIQGYKVDAADYMVKPIDYYSLELVMRKVIKRLSKKKEKTITVTAGYESSVINISELYYIEVFDHYLTDHVRGGDITAKGRLGDVEKELKSSGFYRLSRCYLINMQHIRAIRKSGILVGEVELELSPSKKKELMNAIVEYTGGGI